jgi:hypothetical protein
MDINELMLNGDGIAWYMLSDEVSISESEGLITPVGLVSFLPTGDTLD